MSEREKRSCTMRTWIIAAVLLLSAGGLSADQARLAASPTATGIPEAPAAWDRQDPADALYRDARDAMNAGDHERAVTLFNRIWRSHPRSVYAPDALYWEAFNRYRLGGTEELHRALELLRTQRERYADATTREEGDAQSLSARITGLLARQGNERAARSVVIAANELAGLGAEIGEQVRAQMAEVAAEMAMQGEILGEQATTIAPVLSSMAMPAALASGMGGRTSQIPEQCREQAEIQLPALNALIQMNAERALPVLEKVLERRDECSVYVRRRAIFLIAEKKSERTVDLLLKAADDPDVEVRRQAVFWLSEVEDPRAVDALQRFIETSDDPEVRERAVFALSQHDSPQARRVLRRVAADGGSSAELRSRAVFWLGNEGSADDMAFLKQLFGRVEDPQIRERILFAVAQGQRPGDGDWLLQVAADQDVARELRGRALFWAGEAGASAEELSRLYDRLDDRELRERILFGLSRSTEPAAIDKLIDIARSEDDAGLRKRAIFWLGNSNDPRAADVLVELLTSPQGGGR